MTSKPTLCFTIAGLLVVACGDNVTGPAQPNKPDAKIEVDAPAVDAPIDAPCGTLVGQYRRLANTMFESEEECEQWKIDNNELGYNCFNSLNLKDDGRFTLILTDIGNAGTYEVATDKVTLTAQTAGDMPSPYIISRNPNGSLADRWECFVVE